MTTSKIVYDAFESIEMDASPSDVETAMDAPSQSSNPPTTTAETTPDSDMTEEENERSRRSFYQKMIVGLLLVAFIAFVVVDSLTTGHVGDVIDSFLTWIEANPVPGFFAFMVVYFIATVLFIPGSILTLGAGFVFANAFGLGVGVLLGALSVFFGASAGALVAFLLGRFLFREPVKGLTKKYAIFEALDAALEEKGFRIMTLLRLSPIIPFNAINYIAGVTAVSFSAYALALIGILPGTVLYVFLGASAGSLADSAGSGSDPTITIVVVVVGAVFGIGAVALTSYYAKKELNRVVAEREAAEKEASDSPEDEESATSEAAYNSGVTVEEQRTVAQSSEFDA